MSDALIEADARAGLGWEDIVVRHKVGRNVAWWFVKTYGGKRDYARGDTSRDPSGRGTAEGPQPPQNGDAESLGVDGHTQPARSGADG